jgi:hypothetical protein
MLNFLTKLDHGFLIHMINVTYEINVTQETETE